MSERISYDDKVALNAKEEIAPINKVEDSDLNQIKAVVNDHADEIENLQENQVDGVLRFDTKALLDLETGVTTSSYLVTDDPTPALNGSYKWNGASFELTDYQTISEKTDEVIKDSDIVVTGGGIYDFYNQKQNNLIKDVEFDLKSASTPNAWSELVSGNTFDINNGFIKLLTRGSDQVLSYPMTENLPSIGEIIYAQFYVDLRENHVFTVGKPRIVLVVTTDVGSSSVGEVSLEETTIGCYKLTSEVELSEDNFGGATEIQSINWQLRLGDAGVDCRVGDVRLTKSSDINYLDSRFSTIDKVYKENLFIKNRFTEEIGLTRSGTPLETSFNFGFSLSSSRVSYVDSLDLFGYTGKCAKLDLSTVTNGGLQILRSDYENLDSYNEYKYSLFVNVEIYSPVVTSGEVRLYQDSTQKQAISFSFQIGVNVISIPNTSFDDVYDVLYIRLYPDAGDLDDQTIYWGRTYLYTNSYSPNRLDASRNAEGVTKGDAKITYDLNRDNLFIHNKFLKGIGITRSGTPLETSFNFGFALTDVGTNFVDALDIFGYVGNCAKLDFSTVSNGGLQILKSDYDLLPSVSDNLMFNVEIYSPVTVTGVYRIYQDSTQIGGDVSLSLSIGVNRISVPVSVFGSDYDYFYFRIFPDANAWHNQTIYWGRTYLSGVDINSETLEASINEIYRNLFNNSNRVKVLEDKTEPFALSHWYGKNMTVLGDSITEMNKWQPEVERAIGVLNTNVALGGSMITPYITGNTGQNAGDSIYFRADSVASTSPELILLAGGQNDAIEASGGDIPLGSINDTPYTGAEVSSNPPSFYASYMGVVEKLLNQNKPAYIILMTPFWASSQAAYPAKKLKVNAIVEIGALYGLRVINQLEEVGINYINQDEFLSDTVHPNDAGAVLIGSLVSNYLR